MEWEPRMKWILLIFVLFSPFTMADKGGDFETMVEAIYFEARDQPTLGQVVVGCVIMNRVISRRFPDTVYDVVWQRRQFSYTHDNKDEMMADYQSKLSAARVASKVLYGDVCWAYDGILHYANLKLTKANWHNKMKLILVVGDHSFFIE